MLLSICSRAPPLFQYPSPTRATLDSCYYFLTLLRTMDLSNPSMTRQFSTPTSEHDPQSNGTRGSTHESEINVATSDATDSIAPKTPKYALDRGLIILPADIRLEVYQTTFPEMKRVKACQRSYHNVVPFQCLRLVKGYCDCPPCDVLRRDKLRTALKSHFARDPAIRDEFLKHYLALVHFGWLQAMTQDYANVRVLPRFLNMLFESDMAENFKHLQLHFLWLHTGFLVFEDRELEADFAYDVLQCARIFGLLHRFKIKAELTFGRLTSIRVPFLQRIEKLCRMHLKFGGPGMWAVGYDLRGFAMDFDSRRLETAFTQDHELRKLADEGTFLL